MFTLTKASAETKLILKWLAISFVGLIVLVMLFRFAVAVKNALFPTPPPKPTVGFSKLPIILFPESATDKKYTYTVNTLTGQLPTFDNQIKVFKMAYNAPDLLGLQNAQKKANALGFSSSPYQISSQLYEWLANDKAQRHIRMNIINFNFIITASPQQDPFVLSAINLPNEQIGIQFAQNQLQSAGVYYGDLDQSKTKTSFYKLLNNNFTPGTSLSDAQFIRIDYFQGDVNSLPIYYEKPDSSIMNLLISGGQNQEQIIGANFIHQSPTSEFETYPIKTAKQAYDELTSGKGYIASYGGSSQNIQIKNVFLAYYIGSSPQDFLMPVIIFQGNDGFYAYVSAVTDEWINK